MTAGTHRRGGGRPRKYLSQSNTTTCWSCKKEMRKDNYERHRKGRQCAIDTKKLNAFTPTPTSTQQLVEEQPCRNAPIIPPSRHLGDAGTVKHPPVGSISIHHPTYSILVSSQYQRPPIVPSPSRPTEYRRESFKNARDALFSLRRRRHGSGSIPCSYEVRNLIDYQRNQRVNRAMQARREYLKKQNAEIRQSYQAEFDAIFKPPPCQVPIIPLPLPLPNPLRTTNFEGSPNGIPSPPTSLHNSSRLQLNPIAKFGPRFALEIDMDPIIESRDVWKFPSRHLGMGAEGVVYEVRYNETMKYAMKTHTSLSNHDVSIHSYLKHHFGRLNYQQYVREYHTFDWGGREEFSLTKPYVKSDSMIANETCSNVTEFIIDPHTHSHTHDMMTVDADETFKHGMESYTKLYPMSPMVYQSAFEASVGRMKELNRNRDHQDRSKREIVHYPYLHSFSKLYYSPAFSIFTFYDNDLGIFVRSNELEAIRAKYLEQTFQRRQLFVSLIQGLYHHHRHRVILVDIKPGNIFLKLDSNTSTITRAVYGDYGHSAILDTDYLSNQIGGSDQFFLPFIADTNSAQQSNTLIGRSRWPLKSHVRLPTSIHCLVGRNRDQPTTTRMPPIHVPPHHPNQPPREFKLGTPFYRPPETIVKTGDFIYWTDKCDVYQLGIVLLEIFRGEPFSHHLDQLLYNPPIHPNLSGSGCERESRTACIPVSSRRHGHGVGYRTDLRVDLKNQLDAIQSTRSNRSNFDLIRDGDVDRMLKETFIRPLQEEYSADPIMLSIIDWIARMVSFEAKDRPTMEQIISQMK